MGSTESRVVNQEPEPEESSDVSNTPTISLSINPDLLQNRTPKTPKTPIVEKKVVVEKPPPVVVPELKVDPSKEKEEAEKLRKVIDDINSRQYRAPIRVVQCAEEREACLTCYRENSDLATSVLKCRETAEAFANCARENTKAFVQGKHK